MLDSVKKFDNLKFKQKLILVYCISLITSLFLSICLLVVFCINILKKNYINNLDVVTKQVADNFERRVSDTEMQLFNTISMFQIPDYMSKMDGDKSSYAGQELGYMANQLVSTVLPFDFVYVETNKGYTADTSQKMASGGDEAVEFARRFVEESKDAVLKQGYMWASDERNHVYILHAVRKITSLKHVGYAVARVKRQSVEMLKDDKHDIALLFYNRGRKCIYTEGMEEPLQAAVLEQLEAGGHMEGGQSWDRKAYYAIEKESAGGWHIAGIIPMVSITGMGRSVVVSGILLGLISMVLGSGLMHYLTRKVSLQLEALTNSMAYVSEGSVGVVTPVYCHDDIGQLTECFNNMNQRISKLLDRIVAEERLKNKAELEALEYRYRFLQTQINPHFIYNALETVNAVAKINKAPQISKAIQLIGKYFRSITAYSDQQFITLKEAFSSLEIYMEIYHYIQENNLKVEIDYPQELKDVKIPTMILQPIVDNCFVHGMRSVEELFVIRLKAGQAGDHVRITIEDNGNGIREEVCGSLSESRQGKGAHSGIGLANITERLFLLYGDEGRLSIESSGSGTIVTITVPPHCVSHGPGL